MCIGFTRQQDGTFQQTGSITTRAGRFQWLKDDGKWDGGWKVEPLEDLLARMDHSGPYKYQEYRIMAAEIPPLVIKPTCAGCGMPAGIDCQHSCESVFGAANVTVTRLPIHFNADHQFSLSVRVDVKKGRNFGKAKLKPFWFNSVRCAELFLMEHGLCRKQCDPIGDGTRLASFLGMATPKERKKREPNRAYLAGLALKGSVSLPTPILPVFAC
jgi:hypothetical protein